MREITSHKVNPANDKLDIQVLDQPGAGGANHVYSIEWGNSEGEDRTGHSQRKVVISFQNGPIAEAGVNGVTQEALLAIVEDRLASFQAGQFACEENQSALEAVRAAQGHLHRRTTNRMSRGVEGTNNK